MRKKPSDNINPIKDPYLEEKLTRKQLIELGKCLDDPMYFMETFIKIGHPMKGIIPFEPYPYQKEMANNFVDHRFNIVMTARQMGKTTIVAAFLLWKAMFENNFFILMAAHKQKASVEILSRIKQMYESLPMWIKPGVLAYNRTSVEFDNGSKLFAEATTPNTGRSYSISLLYLDEFAFVDPPHVAEEFWTAIRPTLATGGSAIITSTPSSDEHQYAQIWEEAINNLDDNGELLEGGLGRNGFKSIKVTWRQHPDRDEKWADIEKNSIGEERFRREHNCVVGSTIVTVKDALGHTYQTNIKNLYRSL